MELAMKAYCLSSFHVNLINKRSFDKPILHNTLGYQQPSSHLPSFHCKKATFALSTATSSIGLSSDESKDTFDDEEITETKEDDKFNWYAHWYPVMPVCDLDKRRPQGKKVIGMDVVVWWDRNENEWKVFDDTCPHRLAPLSEGRIDQWGRLQCVYHGWCFGGSGDCKFIPQAPRDGPPIHTSSKARVTVYPSCVQNGILWFWPNADHQSKDILSREKPPFIKEMDDPSFTCPVITRDIQYGYEVLVENLMDPSHVPYAHYGILRISQPPNSLKADKEGGRPLDITVRTFSKDGFTANAETGSSNVFIPPCVLYTCAALGVGGGNPDDYHQSSAGTKEKPAKRLVLVFICIPVSPGSSRIIFVTPRNFGVWIDRVVPRWIFHLGQNLVIDSDLYILHVEERKIKEVGSYNWNKACFVPTRADALVVAFRRWLNKYSNGEVDWGAASATNYYSSSTAAPPREQLMDRYWSHTVSCSSCSVAYKGLKALEMALQVFSMVSIGFGVVAAAAAKQGSRSHTTTTTLLLSSTAVLCFVASKWLSHFIYKNFHFHDYHHAFR